MRVAIAGLELESASFVPVVAEIADFQRSETTGADLIAHYGETNTALGGIIQVLTEAGVELVPILMASAGVGGPASDAAFVHYADRICAGVAQASQDGPLDGVLLHLHGAMVTPTRWDPDREVVERVRTVLGRTVPLMVTLDYHANLDDSWLRSATALFGYHQSPHTDQAETGARAARCLLRTVHGEIRPVAALAKPGVIVPSLFSATNLPPLAGIVAESLALPARMPGLLDVSVFGGFSYADVPNGGFSVVAVADGGAADAGDGAGAAAATIARQTAEELSARLWAVRHELLHRDLVWSLAEGLDHAVVLMTQATKPVVVVEHADRMNDSTYVLREVLRRGLRRVAVPYVWDPAAAATAVAAGAGAEITMSIGGRSSARAGGPVEVRARVLFAGEKTYRGSGAVLHGEHVQLGPCALLDAGGVLISVTSANSTAIDLDPFLQFGLRVEDFALIVLRSKTHFRAAYEPIAEQIILVDTPDWGPADLTTVPYRLVPTERTFPFTDAR